MGVRNKTLTLDDFHISPRAVAGAVLRQNGDPLPGPAEEAQEVPKDIGLGM